MGRRAVDPGWRALEDAMASESPTKVADRLGTDPETISAWKAGRSRPRFNELPAISSALQKDPAYLAREMGMIPDDSRLIRHLQDLVERVDQLRREEARLVGRHGSLIDRAIGNLVSAVIQDAEWSVAVWPAQEGPTECRLRVADRIDLMRVDGALVTPDDARRSFGDLLSEAGAVPSSKGPRWSSPPRWDCLPPKVKDPAPVSRWSVNRLNWSFPAHQWTSTHRAQSIAVVSTTISAHPTDVAALLARSLGYANNSTRELVRSAFPGAAASSERDDRRSLFHDRMMQNPRYHLVWSHYGPGDDASALVPVPTGSTAIVWLRESDQLLHGKHREATEAKRLSVLRDEIEDRMAALTTSVIRVDVDAVRSPSVESVGDAEMTRSLTATSEAINGLLRLGWLHYRQLRSHFEDVELPTETGKVVRYMDPLVSDG